MGNSDETDRLLEHVAQGSPQEWGALLERHRVRLRRMVALRLDRRLQGRIDASDVLQEALLEATARQENAPLRLQFPTTPLTNLLPLFANRLPRPNGNSLTQLRMKSLVGHPLSGP